MVSNTLSTFTGFKGFGSQSEKKGSYQIKHVLLFYVETCVRPVISVHIWSKNFSHSAYMSEKSEAKDGGHSLPNVFPNFSDGLGR